MPRFTPDFLDELKSRMRPSDVIGRYVKLKKQGNEWAGLSPFTKEKTPSFFVNDHKGFYHDFSSGRHGDIISFLQETQRLTFYEAVERLAEEAGLPLPTESPQEAARAEQAKGLAEACAAAAQYFSAMLRRSDGRDAMAYLKGRDVGDEAIAEFTIGFAPDSRTGLKDALINKGFHEKTLVDAGLVIKPEDGGASYDRFRGRVMFPIKGARDRVIAFGGRALDPNARAKYLNSPETPLFHKGNVLYRLSEARAAAAKEKAPLIVCEGYMDVIALWRAGIGRAVAPLGTALTENQIGLLWRASEEPLLCFDGDRAGIGAAHRSIDRALPMLKPGKSLNFAFLPEGQDPDDLINASGRTAFDRVLSDARPLVDVLWDRERSARSLDTPERRAALRSHLRSLVKLIKDKDVRAAYGGELAKRLDAEFAPPARERAGERRRGQQSGNRGGGGGRRANQGFRYEPPPRPSAGLKRQGGPIPWHREAVLLLAAINHPLLLDRQESAFFELELADPGLKSLLSEVLTAYSSDPGLDSTGLKSHLTGSGAADSLERVLNDPELSKHRFLRPDAEIDEVEQGFRNARAHHLYESTLKHEVARSASQMTSIGNDDEWKSATIAREQAKNSISEFDDPKSDDAESQTLLNKLNRFGDGVAERAKKRH